MWCYVCIRHKCIDLWRKRKRKGRRVGDGGARHSREGLGSGFRRRSVRKPSAHPSKELVGGRLLPGLVREKEGESQGIFKLVVERVAAVVEYGVAPRVPATEILDDALAVVEHREPAGELP